MRFEDEYRKLLAEALIDQGEVLVAGNFATLDQYKEASGRYWGLKMALSLCDDATETINKG